jgi:hypothetical protein
MAPQFHALAVARSMRALTRMATAMASRAAPMALAGLLLAGCSSKPLLEPSRMSAEPDATGPMKLVPVTPTTPQSPLKGQAVLLLPDDAAPVKTIRERHYANATRQEIVLDTARNGAGEGVIDVAVQITPAREGRSTDLTLHKPAEDGVRNEIIGRFPDVKMNLVTRAYTNAFGPVGIAIGRHANGATCVFAWQWIEDLRSTTAGSSGFDRFGAAMTGSAKPASVRIRLCRRDQTADQIVAHMEQLRLGAPDALGRLVQMDRSRADGTVQPVDGKGTPVASSSVLRPVEGSLESMLPKSKQPPQSAVAAAATARPASQAPRRLVRVKPREQEWRNQPAYLDRSQPTGADTRKKRFLAPVQAAEAPASAAAAPAPGPAAIAPAVPTASPQRPSADLPLEAFRGPVSQQPRTLAR